MARDPQDERRRHYRLRYPEAERPTARINDSDYLVVDISEGGVRVLLAGGRALPRDQRFAGTVLFPDGEVLMPSLSSCERLQGFPPGWTTIDGEYDDKNPEWRMVGNAVSIPVARWVAERLRTPGDVLDFETHALENGERWPVAAWNVTGNRTGVEASDRPISQTTPSISDFRDLSWSRLSDRALNGFINRAKEGGLWAPIGFLDALESADRKVRVAA